MTIYHPLEASRCLAQLNTLAAQCRSTFLRHFQIRLFDNYKFDKTFRIYEHIFYKQLTVHFALYQILIPFLQ